MLSLLFLLIAFIFVCVSLFLSRTQEAINRELELYVCLCAKRTGCSVACRWHWHKRWEIPKEVCYCFHQLLNNTLNNHKNNINGAGGVQRKIGQLYVLSFFIKLGPFSHVCFNMDIKNPENILCLTVFHTCFPHPCSYPATQGFWTWISHGFIHKTN
jgi:hypothetical protein